MTRPLTIALLLATAAGQTYPGQPTQGHTFIDNRGPQQAVPVNVHQPPSEAPMRVQVTTMPAVNANGVVETREARRTWEYQRITAPPDEDITPQLNQLGASGWDTALQYLTSRGALVVVLKRAR